MKPRVYLETSVIGYLASRPSRDLITAARQQLTRDWWERRRWDFDLFTAQLVLDEARAGDPAAAAERMEALRGIPLLETTEAVSTLAQSLLDEVPLPPRAADDARHIANAVANGMDYLLTWNCTHIANAALRGQIERICRRHGFAAPVICTPEQLM